MKNSVGIIPIFVSHMGCPNACRFCNQRKINGVSDAISPEDMLPFVQSYLKTMKRDQVELAFFGGSFTGIELEKQVAYLEIASELKQKGLIHKIRLSTRPDYIDEEVIKRLKKYGVDLVELGCQSFDEEVLLATQRGHDVAAIDVAVILLKNAEIDFGIQLMLGLPKDNFAKFSDSVKKAIVLKPSCVRLYPALVIRDTELESDYLKGVYTPLSLNEAVAWTAYALKLFDQNGIQVIRMGLQRTDLIDFDASVVAGPFHPAFGEWVMSLLFFEAISKVMDEHRYVLIPNKGCVNSLNKSGHVTDNDVVKMQVQVNTKQISAAVGDHRSNYEKIVRKYSDVTNNSSNTLQLTIKADAQITCNTIEVVVGQMKLNANIMK